MVFGYARVSKNEQSLDIQLEKLKNYGCDEIYQEKISGIREDRSELNKLLERIRKGDKIVVQRLDRLGRRMSLIRYRNQVSAWLSSTLGVEIFPRSVYQFNEIPAEVVPTDVALICVSAFVICSLAALIPAWIASRLDPVKALRYE